MALDIRYGIIVVQWLYEIEFRIAHMTPLSPILRILPFLVQGTRFPFGKIKS